MYKHFIKLLRRLHNEYVIDSARFASFTTFLPNVRSVYIVKERSLRRWQHGVGDIIK